MFTTTMSDEHMTKIKVVDLDKLYNFVVEHFLIQINFDNKKYVWISQIWNLNFSNDLGWRNSQNESCRSQ
jgi:hypothetical protein